MNRCNPYIGTAARFMLMAVVLSGLLTITGCNTSAERKASYEQKMLEKYRANGRELRFEELHKRYDSRLVLYLNKNNDRWWITNFSAWLVSCIFDIPSLAAGGTVYGVIVLIAWWIGVALTGGGILAVLAWIGTHIAIADWTGMSPVIVGILSLCVFYSLCVALFGIFM